MNVLTNCMHPPQTAVEANSPDLFSDTLGNLIHKQHAEEFGHEFDKVVQLEHGLMVALSEPNVKAGNCGVLACAAKQPRFPAFAIFRS